MTVGWAGMSQLPRVAVGSVQPGFDSQPILWALLEVLRRRGLQVQSFLSRAWFAKYLEAGTVTGLNPRHLDSWIMSPEACRTIFRHGAELADLALVEGEFSGINGTQSSGGTLECLCQWLDLPRLAVVDATRISGCRLPDRPERIEGLLLDGVFDDRHLAQVTTDLEALWGIPVLGALELRPSLRAAVASTLRGSRLPRVLLQELGSHFARHWQAEHFDHVLGRREFPADTGQLFDTDPGGVKLTVAVAYDDAFNCYFPDTLELLESRGATVIDFSPLRDESLPPDTDIVYLGCGRPERYAAVLEENHCIKAALRSHLRRGNRVYAEGGGLAYLCQQLETPDGRLRRMVGVFPTTARLSRKPTPPVPVEVTLDRANWLGHAGARLRGYRNSSWLLEPADALAGFVAEPDRRYDIVGTYQAVGSQLHLNFAAQPSFLHHFFYPHLPRPQVPDPWSVVC